LKSTHRKKLLSLIKTRAKISYFVFKPPRETAVSELTKPQLAQSMNESTLQLLEVVGQLEKHLSNFFFGVNIVFALFGRTLDHLFEPEVACTSKHKQP